jgi:4-amino-4-deoxy-L-arabinose transferase-like glycosyltransferase
MVPGLVVALATALRLAWVLVVPTKPVGDFSMYLESAAHVVAHGELDPEFVYMPGYVFLLALVQALGGGVLAAKLVAALLGGLAAGAVYGLTDRLWDRRAALAAGLLYAVWPAGIAVSSVTGTDLPTAILVAVAAWCLVRFGASHPARAALLFGLVMGVAAWMRAVALPLAALAGLYFWTQGMGWRAVVKHSALACAAAGVLLAPWAVRNRLRYGETFITDSHGGLTALVGANPNTDGAYSRSLNRLFFETTGYRLLEEPHREADRASYQMAKDWTRFEPAYALGLVAAKAGRLLDSQRPLLYWPLYRQGVLREPYAGWFSARRRAIELVVDAFWWLLAGAGVAGLGLAVARRRWVALAFVPAQLALTGIYALFFAEARYQLPIVILLFPSAGAALVWLGDAAAALVRERRLFAERRREAIGAGAALALLLTLWPALSWGGGRLRDGHRWAAHVCQVGSSRLVCKWRRDHEAASSGIRGVWNGLGLAPGARARLELPLPSGRWRVRAALDLAPAVPSSGGVVLLRAASGPNEVRAVEVTMERLSRESRAGGTAPVELEIPHGGGPLVLRLEASPAAATRLWLSDLRIERP